MLATVTNNTFIFFGTVMQKVLSTLNSLNQMLGTNILFLSEPKKKQVMLSEFDV